MLNVWELPTSILVNGHDYPIRTDFRVVIDLLTALSDKEMRGDNDRETNLIHCELMRQIMMEDPDSLLDDDYTEFIKKVTEFIDMGERHESDGRKKPKLMDWEQDAPLIIPAVNRVVGHEIRLDNYMHWWTFMSAFHEIGECTFSQVLSLRSKRASGKKLDKWEQEYIRENKDIVFLRDKMTEEDKVKQAADEKALAELFGH